MTTFLNLTAMLRGQALASDQRGITYILGFDKEEFVSYADLYQQSLITLGHLQAKGMQPGDEVVLQVADNKAFLQIFWACLLGGFIPVPLAMGTQPGHRIKLFKVWQTLNSPLLICDEQLPAQLARDAVKYHFEAAAETVASRNLIIDNILQGEVAGTEYEAVTEETAYIQYSSGSTGDPKGVILTHHNLLTNISDIATRSETSAEDRALSWLPLTHDMGLICFHLSCMLRGIDQYLIATPLFIRRPMLWMQKASEHKATQLYSPNFGYQYILSAVQSAEEHPDWDLSAVRLIYNGAEPISKNITETFLRDFAAFGLSQVSMFPGYGMAEACVAVTLPRVGDPLRFIGIERASLSVAEKVKVKEEVGEDTLHFAEVGLPIDHTEVRVADDQDTPLSDYHIGHLQIRGGNVTAGYYNKPEATAALFTADKWLRTGDLGFMAGGKLFITGRAKNLIIVNGQNIYPQDIEEYTITATGLKPGSVVACGIGMGHQQSQEIVLFVQYRKPDASFFALSAEIKEKVHNGIGVSIDRVVAVRAIPKTTSGKVQHYQLRQEYANGDFNEQLRQQEDWEKQQLVPAAFLGSDFSQSLFLALSKVFPGQQITTATDLIGLGLNSLKATRLMSLLEQQGYLLSFAQLLENATVGTLMQLELTKAQKVASIAQAPALEFIPLKAEQYPLWTASQTREGNIAANIHSTVSIDQDINVEAFIQAIETVVDRHESLRSTIKLRDGQPVMRVHSREDLNFGVVVQDLRADGGSEATAQAIARSEASQSFDLASGPLLSVQLLRTEDQRWYFTFTVHHLISDGWSVDVISKELRALYRAYATGGSNPLLPARLQYKDYLHWQDSLRAGSAWEAGVSYWEQELSGELPVLSLPAKGVRPEFPDFKGATEVTCFDAALTTGLRQLSHTHQVTLFTVLMSAVRLVMFRYTGQEDLLIGTDSAGRSHQDLEDQVGYYLNLLPLRFRQEAGMRIESLISDTGEKLMSAYEHQDMAGAVISGKLSAGGRNSLLDVLVLFQNFDNALGFESLIEGVTIQSEAIDNGSALNDLLLEFQEREGAIHLKIKYSSSLYSAEMIAGLGRHLVAVSHSILADQQSSIGSCNMLSAAEYEAVTKTFNATTLVREYAHTSIAGFIGRNRSEAIALIDGDAQLSYQALNAQVESLAAHLQSEGLGSGQICGLLLDRSAAMVTSMLAVQMTGAAYLPLDPEYPESRLSHMLADSGASHVVTTAAYRHLISGDVRVTDINNLSETKLKEVALSAESVAYLMYTSGSTGTPKGVLISHASLRDYAHTVKEYFSLTSADKVIQQSSLSFDTSVEEIYPTLLSGGTLVIAPEGGRDTAALAALIRQHGATVLSSTPLVIDALQAEVASLGSLRILISGGDRLKPSHITAYPATTKLYNTYGPTESTVCASYYEIADKADCAKIGRPVTNRQAYVLDAQLSPVPVGVAGTLWLGGEGIALGYHNLPEQTAARFVANPFGEGNIYNTGDVVSWDATGNLSFHGRADEQIKVRGYRVEPGEVERVALGLAGVEEAIVRGIAGEVNRLALYYRGTADSIEIEQALRSVLPFYMVPDYVLSVAAIPRTANGKVDWKALPAPLAEERSFVAPSTESEKVLAAIWSEVLGREAISSEDHFFELGGHSLRAVQIQARLREQQGTELSIREIFSHPRLKDLAAILEQKQPRTQVEITPLAVQEDYEASVPQRRLWLLSQSEGLSSTYHIPVVIGVQGSLQADILRQALDAMVARHEILRTTFVERGEQIRQKIAPATAAQFETHSLSEDALASGLQNFIDRPFDLQDGPLFRTALFSVAGGTDVLSFVWHHIIMDEWSVKVFLQELKEAYETLAAGETWAPAPLALQHKDIAAWQLDRAEREHDRKFWQQELEGDLPRLELISDFPRPALQTFEGKRHTVKLSVEETALWNAYLSEQGVSAFTGAYALTNLLLFHYSGQDDLIIGTPVVNRNHQDLQGQLGFYLNTIPLRMSVAGIMSFEELLAATRDKMIEVSDHQEFAFDNMVKMLPRQDMSRAPIFDVIIVSEDASRSEVSELAGMKLEEILPEINTSKFDLSFYFRTHEGALELTIEYSTRLYAERRISQMARHGLALLKQAMQQPGQTIQSLNYLETAETRQLLHGFQPEVQDFGQPQTLPAMFEAQATLHPEQTAIRLAEKSISYSQLNEMANQVAHLLSSIYQVQAGDKVAVMMWRSEWLIATLLGVMKAGAAYVPVDLSNPDDRINEILQDSQARLFITDQEDRTITDVPVLGTADMALLGSQSKENPQATTGAEDLAYLIYTSGSTGKPKGVMVAHASVHNLMGGMEEKLQFKTGHRMLAVTSHAFDMSVVEFYLPLTRGGSIVLADNDDIAQPDKLISLIEQYQPRYLQATPGMWNLLVKAGWEGNPEAQLITGGEALTTALASALIKRSAVLWNMYGPTETTVYATWQKVEQPEQSVLIGEPVSNAHGYILNEAGHPVPVGVKGKLYVSGTPLALGYWQREELTSSRFVTFPAFGGQRFYDTGDQCSWTSDGLIRYHGRLDDQVKIRGYRIELGEIQQVILKHELIREVYVGLFEGDKLVAWVVGDQLLDIRDLKHDLRQFLPDYMIPQAFVQMPQLPLTSNGKVNKRALPNPEMGTREYKAPENETQQLLQDMMQEVLGASTISIDDNFFEIGGHSLAGMILIAKIKNHYQINLALRDLFLYPTISGLQNQIDLLLWAKQGNSMTVDQTQNDEITL